MSPESGPGDSSHLWVTSSERVVAEHASEVSLRVAYRDGDTRAIESNLGVLA